MRLFLSMRSYLVRICFVKKKDSAVLQCTKAEVDGMMELTDKKSAKDDWKLPKNIRQIGEPGQGLRILIEDYAYTYLRQLAETNLTCMKTAVLVGRIEEGAIYIQGALEIDMGQEMEKWFTNEHWREIFETIQKWFEGFSVVGWFLSNPGFPTTLTEKLKSIHARNFSGSQYVFFQADVLENEEAIYTYGSMGPSLLSGYYIYYEKNDRMQAYMSNQRGGAGIERESILKDRTTTARFRNVMQEKKEQNAQRKTVAFLYTACLFLVMVIMVIGITMINNYDRMGSMESALHQISESLNESGLPAESEGMEEAVEQENQQALAAEQEDTDEEEAGHEEEPREEPQEEALKDSEEEGQPAAEEAKELEEEEDAQPVMSEAVNEPEQYQVQEGDTLLDISRRKYGSDEMVDDICELNHLEDGDKILAGEMILLP